MDYKIHSTGRAFCFACFCALASTGTVFAAEQVKESYHPTVKGSPVTLIKDNRVTQALGGRLVNLDLWAGEFVHYDDNIYGQKTDKKSDTILTTAAGFHMQAADKGIWNLTVTGQTQYNVYTDHSKYNDLEGFMHVKGSADFNPSLSGRCVLNYDRSYDTVRSLNDIFGLNQYSAGLGVTYNPSPYMAVDLDYRFFAQRRESGYLEYQQYDEHMVALRPAYALTPLVSLYTQLSFAKVLPKKAWAKSGEESVYQKHYSDTTSYSWVGGAAWRLRDDAKMYGEVGLISMRFDDDSYVARTYGAPNKTRPTLRLGGDLSLNADWRVGFDAAYTTTVAGVSTSAAKSHYITAWRALARVSYSPGAGRFTFILSPYYADNKPSNDTNYREGGVGIGMTYCIKDWLNASVGYRYSRLSYSDGYKYGRNTVTAGLAVTF